MKKYKIGNAIAAYPLVLFLSVVCIISISMFFINAIFPFIWYQKLNSTVQKYMFVVEKFGYLTNEETDSFMEELKTQGFDISKIDIEVPKNPLSYGELINFKVSYRYEYKNINMSDGKLGLKNREINMVVSKNSYSKI